MGEMSEYISDNPQIIVNGFIRACISGFLIILMLTGAKPAIPVRMKAVPVMITQLW